MPPMFAETLRTVARAAGIRHGQLRSDLPEFFGIPSLIPPDLVRHWTRVIARSRRLLETLPPPTGPRVAMITTVAKLANNHSYAAVLAYALRLRGADPVVIYCDSALAGCERTTILHVSPEEFLLQGPRRICSSCYLKGQELFRVSGLPTYPLSRFLTPEARREIEDFVTSLPPEEYYRFSYKGLELGPQVEASVARFFFSHAPDLSEPNRKVAARFVSGAVTMAEAMLRMDAELTPKIFAPCYGVYVSRGTPWLVAQAKGKRCVTWARMDVEETITLGEGGHPIVELAARRTGPWNDLALTREQRARLDAFLSKSEQGDSARTVNRNPVANRAALLQELRLDPARPIVAMYSNCGFDSKLLYTTPLYPDVLSWTFDTIERFRGRREQLVIRVHPYESWIPLIEQTAARIAQRFPELPENIRVVPPESALSSYALGRASQAALVYGSLIGLELAATGTPVIAAGRGAYWQKGFTYDVHTHADYAALLNQLEDLAKPNPERTQAARRFAYYYYLMRQLPFAPFNHDVHAGLQRAPWWKVFRSLSDLGPGHDPHLDAICDHFLYGREALAGEGA